MGEVLTSQQLLHNSYHLSIRSSLLAIQSTLSLQQIMLRSDHSTFADIKSAIAEQNANLQRFTKTITETFSKISSYKPPPPQPRSTPSATVSAGSPPKMTPTTTIAATGSTTPAPPLTSAVDAAVVGSTTPSATIVADAASAAAPSLPIMAPATIAGSTTAAPPSPLSSIVAGSTTINCNSKLQQPPHQNHSPSFASSTSSSTLKTNLDSRSINSLLHGYCIKMSSGLNHARTVFDHFIEHGRCLNVVACNALIYSHVQLNSAYGAGMVFAEMNKPTDSSLQLNKYETTSSALFYFILQSIISSSEMSLCTKMLGENKVFIFDPGGIVNAKNIISMKVTIKKINPLSYQIKPDLYSGDMLLNVFCAGPILNPAWSNEMEWTDAHNTFVEVNKPTESSLQLKRYDAISSTSFYNHHEPTICPTKNPVSRKKKLRENEIFIFDPGGTFPLEFTFEACCAYGDICFHTDATNDLEDKAFSRGW